MAFSSGGSIGSVASGTLNQASIVLTTTATVAAGELAVVWIAVDNFNTTDADHGEIDSVVDSAGGNTWVKFGEITNGQGTAQTGATGSLWGSRLTNQLTSGGTITAAFDNVTSRDASAMSGWKFTCSNPISVAQLVTAVGDAADPAAISIAGLPSKEYLFLWLLAYEGGTAVVVTHDADYSAVTQAGQGTGAAGMTIIGAFRIATLTGDTVDAATDTDRDHAQVLIALQEDAAAAYTLTAAQGSYTLSGQSVNLLFGRKLTAVQGSYALSGQSANLLFNRLLAAVQGSYVLSGQAANLLFGRRLVAAQGSYSLSGQAANLLFGRLLAALQGSYALTGQSANLVYSASTYILVADLGSYALTGQNANLLAAKLLAANQGSYSLTGQSAGLLFGRRLVAVQGSYILTGQAASLFFGRKLIALQGSYILSGQIAVLTFSGFVFVVIPDEERVFIVPSENRIITVPSENRIFTV